MHSRLHLMILFFFWKLVLPVWWYYLFICMLYHLHYDNRLPWSDRDCIVLHSLKTRLAFMFYYLYYYSLYWIVLLRQILATASKTVLVAYTSGCHTGFLLITRATHASLHSTCKSMGCLANAMFVQLNNYYFSVNEFR